MNVEHPKLKIFIDQLFNLTFHKNTDRADVSFHVDVSNITSTALLRTACIFDDARNLIRE